MKKIYIAFILIASLLFVGYAGSSNMNRSNTLSADVAVGATVNTFGWEPGTRGVIEVSGTFGSGTLTLYRWIGSGNVASGNGAWVAFSGAALSAAGGTEFVTSAERISVGLSGSTSPDLDYIILPIRY